MEKIYEIGAMIYQTLVVDNNGVINIPLNAKSVLEVSTRKDVNSEPNGVKSLTNGIVAFRLKDFDNISKSRFLIISLDSLTCERALAISNLADALTKFCGYYKEAEVLLEANGIAVLEPADEAFEEEAMLTPEVEINWEDDTETQYMTITVDNNTKLVVEKMKDRDKNDEFRVFVDVCGERTQNLAEVKYLPGKEKPFRIEVCGNSRTFTHTFDVELERPVLTYQDENGNYCLSPYAKKLLSNPETAAKLLFKLENEQK